MKRRWWLIALISGLIILAWAEFPAIRSVIAPPTTTPSPKLPSPTVTSAPSLSVSPEQLQKDLQNLNFERYTAQGRQRTRAYLRQTLERNGWTVQEHRFKQGINVWAERSGAAANPQKILLGAHYDTVPETVGASDNASGVVVLLEVARLLANTPLNQTLQIVFFDQEEQGVLGSAAWASTAALTKNLTGAVVLDMVGFTCKTVGCQQKPEGLNVQLPSDRGDFLAALGDAEHPDLLKAIETSALPDRPPILTLSIPFKGLLVPLVVRSDHIPFWLQDIGAALITDTAFLRNPHYHQSSDALETLDMPFLTDSAQIVVQSIWKLAQG